MREWLSRPVSPHHRVYHAATQYLTEAEMTNTSYSETDHPSPRRRSRRNSAIPRGLGIGWERLRRGFQSAVEAGSRQAGRLRIRKKKKKKKDWYCARQTDIEERKPLIAPSHQSSATDDETSSQELWTFSDANTDDMTLFARERHLSSTTRFI